MIMLPPRYTKTVRISVDHGVESVKVTATYAGVDDGQDDHKVETMIKAGESHVFEAMSENMGSWQAVRKIKHLR